MPLFFLLTFAITWTAWLAPLPLGGPVFYVGVFAPALVAIGLTAYAQGRAGVTELLSGIARWDVGARWYVFAVSYTFVLKLLAAVIHRVVRGEWPAFGTEPVILMFAAILISTWAQAGEEIGWRAYALPRLTKSIGLAGASVLLGVIWALWHLPLFLLPGSGSHGQPFPVYLLHVVSVSVVLAWVYWKTKRSLFVVMVMHASINNTMGIVPGALPYPVPLWSFQASVVTWSMVGLSLASATLLLFRLGLNRFDRVPQ